MSSAEQKETRMDGKLRSIFLLSMMLIVVTLAVYWQAGNHGFINYDDDEYVYQNPHVAGGITGANIVWALTSVHAANWHPLTWLSHMADVDLYGMAPSGHHFTSIFIHAAASVLLFLLLFRLTDSTWRSSFVAALFALHPLHVQSVAWIAERKDVLSALFCFLTLLLYAKYVRKHKPLHYWLTLCSFILGLMSKPMLVTLPLVMLLIDFWPLNRLAPKDQAQDHLSTLTQLVKEKLPFFACSLFSAAITLYAQQKGGATIAFDSLPFSLRLENAVIAYATYLVLTLWPHDLAVFYPFPDSFPLWQLTGSFLVLLVVSTVAIQTRQRHPYLLAGWLWFFITLVPVIGLVQVGAQSMADRYTYLPLIGLFVMATWGIPALANHLGYRQQLLAPLAVGVITAFTAITWQQLGYWRDGVSLFRHAIEVTSGNFMMHNNLGIALVEKDNPDAAIEEYRQALAINPNFVEAYNNLGVALGMKGELDSAIKHFQKALAIKPDYASADNNIGLAFGKKGDLDTAIKYFQEALAIAPDLASAQDNLREALEEKGNQIAAVNDNRKSIVIEPTLASTHFSQGTALGNKGELDGAIKEFREALAINPNFAPAHLALGIVLGNKGDMDAAILEFREALRLTPNNAAAHFNLGTALINKQDWDGAIKELREGLAIEPNSEGAQGYIEFALEQKRNSGKAAK